MKITRTSDKVLFYTNSGIKTLSQECNIFAHPRNEKTILISETGTSQTENIAFQVDYDKLEDYAGNLFAPYRPKAVFNTSKIQNELFSRLKGVNSNII